MDEYYRAETWERGFPVAPNFIDAGGFKVLAMLLSDDYLTVKTLLIPIPFLKIKKKCRKISVYRVCQQDDVRL